MQNDGLSSPRSIAPLRLGQASLKRAAWRACRCLPFDVGGPNTARPTAARQIGLWNSRIWLLLRESSTSTWTGLGIFR